MKIYATILLMIFLNGCMAPQADGTINNSTMLNGQGQYEITTQEVQYFENVRGYLAKPSQPGQYPGVIMIHEWWGLNDNIRQMARELARNGYSVIAVDLYGGAVATTPDEARALVAALDSTRAKQNMRAAAQFLRENENVTKTASLGWCFGGGQSMQLAVSGEELDATIIYYGNIITDEAQLQSINWPVLGIFGENDTSIPTTNVREFRAKLDQLGIENEVYIYPNVGHAFANPSGMNYAPEETRDAWNKTLDFLNMHLK